MMESCFGGTNYNKLLMVHANISCSAKVINRPKAKLRHSCNALYEFLMELKKRALFILFYQRMSSPSPWRMIP